MTNLQNPFVAASQAYSASGQSPAFPVGSVQSIHLDINLTALTGTGASVNFTYYRVGQDGVLFPVWSGGVAAVGQLSVNIGPGMEVPKDPGATGVLAWTLGGTTPSATMSINIRGK